ncbi:hypothetical protein [Parasitella parasitica]|uniref:Uncharacterized protein n=1 Tax=Parasitella parasitica TaxID=35722 RepID=A0A0B7N7V8_9FUNG|nr:hypothetical protein [Parasitella parasitica]
MSKVSVKNDILPSFEPIKQPQNVQKRKRTSAALKDADSKHSVPNKRLRGKRNTVANTTDAATSAPSSVTISKSVVWIGATLMQDEKDDIKNEEASSVSAAFSIFYGQNDSRNCTEKVNIKQNQNIDHVYIMGVIRALEKCEDDASALSIHTGSKVLQSVLDQDKQDEESICKQIKEKIAKRRGSTSIRSATSQEDEFQAAHKLASEKLLEVDAMEIDVAETSQVVDSLQVTECKQDASVTTTTTTTTIAITTTPTEDAELVNDNAETTATTTTVVKGKTITTIFTDQAAEQKQQFLPPTPTSPTWATTLNLRSFLDILKAPFTRNK